MTDRVSVIQWQPVVDAAAQFLEVPDFEDQERGYKLEVAASVGELAAAVQSGGDVQAALTAALRHKRNNLLSWQLVDTYLKWAKSKPVESTAGLEAAFDSSVTHREALERYLNHLPNEVASGRGTRLSLGSFMLMGRGEPEQTPIYRSQAVANVRKLTGWQSDPESDVDDYFDAVAMFDEFQAAAVSAGVDVQSPLHAQGLLYATTSWEPSTDWPRALVNAVTTLRRSRLMTKSLDLATALADYDRSEAAERLQLAADQRNDFVERFPTSAWADLSLEQYALGLPESKAGVSYQLEFVATDCGSIGGGSANKHLIYFSSDRDAFKFDYEKYGDDVTAWSEIRTGYQQLIERAAEGDFESIDEIDALWAAPSVRTKVAWMYFPDQLMPIYSESHLDFWLSIFGVEAAKKGRMAKNRLVFETLAAMPEFEGWQTLEMMHFLYWWTDPNPGHTIVKIAPGEDARLWAECLASGQIRLGWPGTGDLSQFENDDELRAHYSAHYPDDNKSTTTKAIRALRTFRDLEEGDIVVANQGTKKVVGIGRVTGGYRFDAELTDYRHTVEVNWFDTTPRDVDFGAAWRPTLVEIKPDDYHRLIRQQAAARGHEPVAAPLPQVPALHREAERLLNRTGQIIFYGPPGTGKTYSARRHAAWLLGGGSAVPEAARAFGPATDLQGHEAELLTAATSDERPSWVVVANPSYWSFDELFEKGWEDFDYGRLQRNFDELQSGDEVFGYEATPVKKFVATARISRALYTNDRDRKQIDIEAGVRPPRSVSWEELNADPIMAASEPLTHRMQGTLFRLEPHEAARLRQLAGLDTESGSANTGVARLTRVTFHPTYAYEDFIEGYKPTESGNGGLELTMRDGIFKKVCRAAAADPDNPYVIMIDEINRGNVPKIFGELITLIEKDKRGMPLTLPQSGEPFHVPPNVHIIATMNTADRSVHVLDAALRRRFAFVELMPDHELLSSKVGPLALDEFLDRLNEKIRSIIGREKQVGHAVLMSEGAPVASAAEFALAFKYELLPLLQEYTYGNYNDLAELLGPEVINEERQLPNLEMIDDPERLVEALAKHLTAA